MKPATLIKLLSTVLLLTSAWSCGGGAGGGSASGGIGGSGFQASSVGSVSAVGSVTVNGVKYETTGATITDDTGAALSEASFALGQTVEVDGRVNADGLNGTAERVTVITALQGPVDQVVDAGRLIVMGQPVAIDDQTVIGDSVTNIGGIGSLSGFVEVHGNVDANGVLRATRIESKATIDLFKVAGFVGPSPTGASFTINSLTVASSATGLNAGDFVSVKGSNLLPGPPQTLTATSVDKRDRSFADDEFAELHGFIASNGPTFTLVTGAGTFQFRTDAATEFEGGGAVDLVVGLNVEVEGAFSGGVLFADKVEVEDGIRLAIGIDNTSKNLTGLTVSPANMSRIVLKLNDQTEIDDSRGGAFPENPTPAELLNSLDGNETLNVRARVSTTVLPTASELVATEIKISGNAPSNIGFRAPLDSDPGPNDELTILGIRILSDQVSSFLGANDSGEIGREQFFNSVTTGTLVEVEGNATADNEITATLLGIED